MQTSPPVVKPLLYCQVTQAQQYPVKKPWRYGPFKNKNTLLAAV